MASLGAGLNDEELMIQEASDHDRLALKSG